MKKAWKTILIVALCILIVGEIVLGVGLATGGSPDRIWEAAYEHYDIGSIFAFIKSSGIADLLARLSQDLGEAMVGINEQEIALLMAERGQ